MFLSLEAVAILIDKEQLSHVDNSHEIRKLLCHLLVKSSDCAYCIGVEGKQPINPKGQCHFGCIEIEWEPEPDGRWCSSESSRRRRLQSLINQHLLPSTMTTRRPERRTHLFIIAFWKIESIKNDISYSSASLFSLTWGKNGNPPIPS